MSNQIDKILLPKCKKCNKRHEFECAKVCERCGRNTHNASQCYAKKDLEGNPIDDDF